MDYAYMKRRYKWTDENPLKTSAMHYFVSGSVEALFT